MVLAKCAVKQFYVRLIAGVPSRAMNKRFRGVSPMYVFPTYDQDEPFGKVQTCYIRVRAAVAMVDQPPLFFIFLSIFRLAARFSRLMFHRANLLDLVDSPRSELYDL